MNRRIWLLALVGGLSLSLCNSLSANTLYVATNGDGTDGLTWQTAFATIQSAVTAAASEPNAVTILVGSAGTGHGSGHYKENITLSLAHLTLQSESGYQQTVIESNAANVHAVTVNGNFITIRGFSIYGSTTNTAAIALVGANSCTVEENRCGWLDGAYFRNYRGILLSGAGGHTVRNNLCTYNNNAGIFLSGTTGNLVQSNTCSYSGTAGIAIQSSSQMNRILGNTCTYNSTSGLDLDDSNLNTLAQNTCTHTAAYPGISLSAAQNNVVTENLCSENSYGIELTGTAHYNSLTCNLTQNNLYDGIQLKGSSNQVVANTSRLNYQGMYAFQCQNNTIYRNKFSDNTSKQVNAYYTSSAGDLWNSAIPFCYAYNDSICLSKMGSYYSDYAGSDTKNSDGVGEDPYTTTPSLSSLQKQDLYPLIDPDMTYAVQAWYLAGEGRMAMEPNQAGLLQPLPGSSSLLWLSDTAAIEEIAFDALDGTDGWNGQIRFSTSFAGSTIQIQVGYVDPNEGIFVSGGPVATLSGTASIFTYETSGQSFSVKDGQYLAVQITNTSATARQFYVGGAWTYLSAPAGTQTPWPGTTEQPPLPPVNPADLNGDGWVDMEDMAWLSARWEQTGCEELNDYCEFADIDKSGRVGLGDLEILATFWLMGPEDLLTGDWNEDFKVNMDDMALLSDAWTGDLSQLVDLCENWLKGCYLLQPGDEPIE